MLFFSLSSFKFLGGKTNKTEEVGNTATVLASALVSNFEFLNYKLNIRLLNNWFKGLGLNADGYQSYGTFEVR